MITCSIAIVATTIVGQSATVSVQSAEELRMALVVAAPGTTIVLKDGTFVGGVHVSNVHGSGGRPIVIIGSAGTKVIGGNTGLQLSNVSHLEIRNMQFVKQRQNGINIDDGGNVTRPSHHIKISKVHVSDLPKGNHDGIKLSGVDDFTIEHCILERWGGSGIDMVGCHRGVISDCTFKDGGESGVQAKGGSENVRVTHCTFVNYGQRGVNLGGSTGLEYFRPPIAKMHPGQRYEARNLRVERCIFVGGMSAIALVGVDGAMVEFNTIFVPQKWSFRILQETATSDFIKCRNGRFTDNIINYFAANSIGGGVNIGPGTDPVSFVFERNFWFCEDQPQRSTHTPVLPTPENDGVYGKHPQFMDPYKLNFKTQPESPARFFGAHGIPRTTIVK